MPHCKQEGEGEEGEIFYVFRVLDVFVFLARGRESDLRFFLLDPRFARMTVPSVRLIC